MKSASVRMLLGRAPVTKLDPAATALITIDVQREYFKDQFSAKLYVPQATTALALTRSLVQFADANGMSIFHVKQLAPPNSPVFAAHSETAELHPELGYGNHHTVIHKKAVSGMADPELDKQLRARGINTVILCGYLTHMCVSSTARDAADLGYHVVVAADACATRDIADGNGNVIPHDTLHRIALAEIADAFGTVMPTASVLALPLQKAQIP